MKPFKGLFPIVPWLMRIAAVFFVITHFWDAFLNFDIQNLKFYVSALFVVFSILLFIGGFLGKNSLTVVSSLILVLVTIFHAFVMIGAKVNVNFASFILLGTIFLYFLSTGNKKS